MGTGPRVLVVDDDDDCRAALVRTLERAGMRAVAAASASDALARLDAGELDAIVVDHEMPGTTGGELAALVRAREVSSGRPRIRIVGVTGYALEAVEGPGPIDVTLPKPVRATQLIAALRARAEVRDVTPPDAAATAEDDPDVAALRPRFLARRRAELPRLRAALDAGDFETVRRAGHAWTGSAAIYGLPSLASLAEHLGSAARARDGAATSRVIEEIAALLAGPPG